MHKMFFHSNRNSQYDKFESLSPREHVRFLSRGKTHELPSICLMGFYPNLFHEVLRSFQAAHSYCLIQSYHYALFQYGKTWMSFVYPGIGAPSAAICLEQSIAMGVRIVLFFGRAGALDTSLKLGDLFVPDRFYIQEGTSAHYTGLSYSRPDDDMQSQIKHVLCKRSISYKTGSTCSMDAPYRETHKWISEMRRKQCVTVDMEASALAAVSTHRSIKLGAFFTISECFNGKKWEFKHSQDCKSVPKPKEMLNWASEAAFSYISKNSSCS